VTSRDIDTKAVYVSRKKDVSAKGVLTYDHLLATVVCLLKESGVEIIKVKFPLNCELVVRIEDVERERRLWLLERRGVPAYAQELAIALNPSRCPCTSTELYIDVVNSVDIDDEHELSFRAR